MLQISGLLYRGILSVLLGILYTAGTNDNALLKRFVPDFGKLLAIIGRTLGIRNLDFNLPGVSPNSRN
jgi:hypothetical protein